MIKLIPFSQRPLSTPSTIQFSCQKLAHPFSLQRLIHLCHLDRLHLFYTIQNHLNTQFIISLNRCTLSCTPNDLDLHSSLSLNLGKIPLIQTVFPISLALTKSSLIMLLTFQMLFPPICMITPLDPYATSNLPRGNTSLLSFQA